ncbi:MAG: hypothetical protein NTW79_02975 [Candidatus Berkelbacteria bacterium]|nr:hypothetical protein [Candidatus Berkelbacteria bacterium]
MGVEQGEIHPTPDEREVIDKQLPEGSAIRRSSESRIGWREKIGNVSPENINQIRELSFSDSGDKIANERHETYQGTIDGHSYIITKVLDEINKQYFQAVIDGKELSQKDAERLYQLFGDVNKMAKDETSWDEQMKFEQQQEETHQIVQELFCEK